MVNRKRTQLFSNNQLHCNYIISFLKNIDVAMYIVIIITITNIHKCFYLMYQNKTLNWLVVFRQNGSSISQVRLVYVNEYVMIRGKFKIVSTVIIMRFPYRSILFNENRIYYLQYY